MITYKSGDLFESEMQTLVITVNCVGVMGKGIALGAKKRWPAMFREYRDLCKYEMIKVGECWGLPYYRGDDKLILLFPTKDHWRFPSELPWIEDGLSDFIESRDWWEITSIAFPALGCGNGGLDFVTQVQPLMEEYLKDLPIEIEIYKPRR